MGGRRPVRSPPRSRLDDRRRRAGGGVASLGRHARPVGAAAPSRARRGARRVHAHALAGAVADRAADARLLRRYGGSSAPAGAVAGGMEGLARGVVALIHIVVPNWNGAERLRSCVRSLAAQDAAEFEIVAVDNGSVDDSLVVLAELAAEIAPVPLTVLRNDRNLGFAGGVNRGIRHALAAGADAVALFNNDAVADTRWLSSLQRVLDAAPGVAIVAG